MNALARQLHPSGQLPLTARPSRQSIRMSHSRKQVMVSCGRKYQLQYVERLEKIARPATLIFGSAVHTAIASYLTAFAFGLFTDPVDVFRREWQQQTGNQIIEYATGWDADAMLATGVLLLQRFVEDWVRRGWTVVIDVQGVPVIERELQVRLPNGDSYMVIIDALVRTAEGRILVDDFKTPATPAFDGFASLSDQLLGYQLVVDAHAQALGISQVDGLLFHELIKKKIPKTSKGEGPVLHVAEPAARRAQEDLDAFIRELMYVGRDIREQRFARRPMEAFSSPCQLCDFANLCIRGDRSGLRQRPNRDVSHKALLPAEPQPATLI